MLFLRIKAQPFWQATRFSNDVYQIPWLYLQANRNLQWRISISEENGGKRENRNIWNGVKENATKPQAK